MSETTPNTLFCGIQGLPTGNRDIFLFSSLEAFRRLFCDKTRAILRHRQAASEKTMVDFAGAIGLRYEFVRKQIQLLEEHGVIVREGMASGESVFSRHFDRVILQMSFRKCATSVLRLGVQSAPDEVFPDDCDRVLGSIDEITRAISKNYGLEILRTLATSNPYTMAELGRAAGVSKNGNYIFNLLDRLAALGLVTFLGPDRRYPTLTYDGLTLELVLSPESNAGEGRFERKVTP